jgi:hypothetical protein
MLTRCTEDIESELTYRGACFPKLLREGLLSIALLRQVQHLDCDASICGSAIMAPRIALPARYPPIGAWPALMRADMAAAYLDYRDTAELARAVARGEAPRPTGFHGTGRARQPIWSKVAIDHFTAPSRAMNLDRLEGEDLAPLA